MLPVTHLFAFLGSGMKATGCGSKFPHCTSVFGTQIPSLLRVALTPSAEASISHPSQASSTLLLAPCETATADLNRTRLSFTWHTLTQPLPLWQDATVCQPTHGRSLTSVEQTARLEERSGAREARQVSSLRPPAQGGLSLRTLRTLRVRQDCGSRWVCFLGAPASNPGGRGQGEGCRPFPQA